MKIMASGGCRIGLGPAVKPYIQYMRQTGPNGRSLPPSQVASHGTRVQRLPSHVRLVADQLVEKGLGYSMFGFRLTGKKHRSTRYSTVRWRLICHRLANSILAPRLSLQFSREIYVCVSIKEIMDVFHQTITLLRAVIKAYCRE